MSLGEKIKISRMQKKMSQSDLAKAADVHQKNISKYENDGVVPSALTLKAIADALAVTTDYLLGSDLEDTIKDKALLEQFKLVDTLEQADKEALMRVVSAYIRDTKTKQAYQ